VSRIYEIGEIVRDLRFKNQYVEIIEYSPPAGHSPGYYRVKSLVTGAKRINKPTELKPIIIKPDYFSELILQ